MHAAKILAAAALLTAAAVAGCATKPELSAAEIAKLKGGTTKVVVYGFCVPMDHLIKAAITRNTITYVVNGRPVGTMKSCSYGTFNVPSGYWSSEFQISNHIFPQPVQPLAFRPGATQYLHMRPAGNSTFSADWVSKDVAERGIAEIKTIGQMF